MKRIKGQTIKPHFVPNELLDDVLNELKEKYPDEIYDVVDYFSNEVEWDPGGMLMLDDVTLTFDLKESVLCCKGQFLDILYFKILDYERAGARGVNNKFYKIHGAYNCLCLSEMAFKSLCALMNDVSIQEQGAVSTEKRINKLLQLSKEGVVVQVTRGEDGKYYKYEPGKDTN